MAPKPASVDPLALSLKPQYPAERLAAAAALLRQQHPTVGGSRIHKLIPDRTPATYLQTQKLIPRPPYELKTEG